MIPGERDPQDDAEAQRRHQLAEGWATIRDIGTAAPHAAPSERRHHREAGLELAVRRIMIGSHAHRHRLEHERTA
jgi:hypothetical protein